MLLTENVEVSWHYKSKEHYENLGYKFTNFGDKFIVKTIDLNDTSHAEIEIMCDCEDCKKTKTEQWYKYKEYITKNNGKYYCKKCKMGISGTKNSLKARLKNSKTFEQWCIDNNRELELKLWDYELNDKLPSEVSYATKSKYYFKCPRGLHESELKSIGSFTRNTSGNIKCNKCVSFAQYLIDLYGENALKDYWSENNTLNPWEIGYSSHQEVYIKCQNNSNHYEYVMKVYCFTVQNQRCPYCSNSKACIENSLGQYIIDNYGEEFLNKIWSDKNDKSPFEYTPSSGLEVWWSCPEGKHEDYLRNIKDSNTCEFRCPACISEKEESLLQEKVRVYLNNLGYKINHEYRTIIKCINPKTKHILPYDNEVLLNNENYLVVEVNGKQHEELCGYHMIQAKANNTTPEEEFEYQQWKDEYKKQYALSQGYNYLAISYKDIEKSDNYKNLIDNKIQEILTNQKAS